MPGPYMLFRGLFLFDLATQDANYYEDGLIAVMFNFAPLEVTSANAKIFTSSHWRHGAIFRPL